MSAATQALPLLPVAGEPAVPAGPAFRFTLDGDPGLEAHLADICDRVRIGIEQLVPRDRLEGVLLGGGYGRGEGGVLLTTAGDRPYNDLEFYVLLRGPTILNEWRYRSGLAKLAHALSGPAGVEVEFKVISVASLQRSAITMFYYDLVCGHRRVCGRPGLLTGCAHHRRGGDIPLAEATRLLLNRGSGLLFSRQRLNRHPFTADDADFVERNLAKARLALGDAVLTACGQYHWSCRERVRRLARLQPGGEPPWLEAVRTEHARGMIFKLRPHRSERSVVELEKDFAELSQLSRRVWLWLESRRLGTDFRSPVDYALHRAPKCPGAPAWRNWLVNGRRLGLKELLSRRAFRYPRERLLRALPVLLWQPALLVDAGVRHCLQRELRTPAADAAGLAVAYTRLWEFFR
ncbi:MAG TPA: hypothetical protein VG734_13475 [Lacunisphaera sp.]|nr:hypothetical protein [Lacunisphaera sp.]